MMKIEEVLAYSDYTIVEERPSQIDPDKKTHVATGMVCPSCKSEGRLIPHSHSRKCWSCGLKMTVHGNGLNCVMSETVGQRMKRYFRMLGVGK